jgi:hypothetical protein
MHVTGVTHIDGDDKVFREIDDLYHIDGFYHTIEEFEAAHGGDNHLQCDYDQVWQ